LGFLSKQTGDFIFRHARLDLADGSLHRSGATLTQLSEAFLFDGQQIHAQPGQISIEIQPIRREAVRAQAQSSGQQAENLRNLMPS
jgi:hypothetical protein